MTEGGGGEASDHKVYLWYFLARRRLQTDKVLRCYTGFTHCTSIDECRWCELGIARFYKIKTGYLSPGRVFVHSL